MQLSPGSKIPRCNLMCTSEPESYCQDFQHGICKETWISRARAGKQQMLQITNCCFILVFVLLWPHTLLLAACSWSRVAQCEQTNQNDISSELRHSPDPDTFSVYVMAYKSCQIGNIARTSLASSPADHSCPKTYYNNKKSLSSNGV